MSSTQICIKIACEADKHLRDWAELGPKGKFTGIGKVVTQLVLAEAVRRETRRDERRRLANELLRTEESVGV